MLSPYESAYSQKISALHPLKTSKDLFEFFGSESFEIVNLKISTLM
jgi:hypothetical protein